MHRAYNQKELVAYMLEHHTPTQSGCALMAMCLHAMGVKSYLAVLQAQGAQV